MEAREPFITAAQAAKYLGIHRDTIYPLLQAGALKGYRLGRSWKTKASWCDEFLYGRVAG